jgi:hypothetical protein
MTVASRATLKAYFETGDVMTAQSFIDLIDSAPSLIDSTAQTFNSDIVVPNLIATNVSAAGGAITGTLVASAATFTGRVRQGVSAAASAADSRGDFLVCQEATVGAATTARVAFLPSTSNIASLKVKVLVGGSAGAGGLEINAGITGNKTFFGTLVVSAAGFYEFTNVSARNLTGVSGAIEMVASGASAATNCIGVVQYYQRA